MDRTMYVSIPPCFPICSSTPSRWASDEALTLSIEQCWPLPGAQRSRMYVWMGNPAAAGSTRAW
ncbi:MAG TPA: hypothetical protein VFV66_26070 [Nonomuraea sp.]|nr:hypothetical protein [Nonomuraea sp.]